MTLHKPLIMQPGGADPDLTYSGAELRALTAAAYPWQGVITSPQVTTLSPFGVVQRGAGANFSVDIHAGVAVVVGDDVANQLNYLCWSDATFNLTTPGAPGSGTRLHRVGLQVRDKLNNGVWTGYDFIPVLVQDTGSGFPAEPASFLTLAQVSITTGQASVLAANITDMRVPADRISTVYKAGVTTRSSTGALVDPDLSINLPGNSVHRVTLFLDWTCISGAHLQYQWNRPSGATGTWGGVGDIGGATGNTQQGYGWSLSESLNSPTAGGPYGAVREGIIVCGAGDPQPLAVTWAPTTATSLTLNNGSFLEVRRVG